MFYVCIIVYFRRYHEIILDLLLIIVLVLGLNVFVAIEWQSQCFQVHLTGSKLLSIDVSSTFHTNDPSMTFAQEMAVIFSNCAGNLSCCLFIHPLVLNCVHVASGS